MNSITMVLYGIHEYQYDRAYGLSLMIVSPFIILLSILSKKMEKHKEIYLVLLKMVIVFVIVFTIVGDFNSNLAQEIPDSKNVMLQKGFFFGVNLYAQQFLMAKWYYQNLFFAAIG